MPSSYTTNLGIEKPATGEQSGTWGDTVNLNYDLFDQAINGVQSVTLAAAGSSGSPRVLAITDGTVSEGRNKFIEFVDGGDLGATAYVQLTPNDAEKIVHFRNSLSGGRSVIVFQGTYNASNDFEIPNGKDVVLKFDGAGSGAVVEDVFVDLQATALTTPSLTATGGTLDGVAIGGTTPAAGAFTTLSATSTDAGATAGPVLDLYRNSASPADDDFIGGFDLTGEDDGGNKTTYARVVGQIKDVTDGTEDADLVLYTMNAGTLTEGARLAPGGKWFVGDVLGSSPSGEIIAYRSGGNRPLIRLLDSTNDSFIEGGQTLRFGTFNSLGTTVDMELDANGNLILSGGYAQSRGGTFSVGAGGGTEVLSAFPAGMYLFSINVLGTNIETNVTAVVQVANNLTVGISELSNFNYLSSLAVALQAQDNVAQWGFDASRARTMQVVITNSIGNTATATWRMLRLA